MKNHRNSRVNKDLMLLIYPNKNQSWMHFYRDKLQVLQKLKSKNQTYPQRLIKALIKRSNKFSVRTKQLNNNKTNKTR